MLTSSMFVMAGSSSHLSNTSISQRMVQSNSCLESMSQGAQKAKIPPKRAKGKNVPCHCKTTREIHAGHRDLEKMSQNSVTMAPAALEACILWLWLIQEPHWIAGHVSHVWHNLWLSLCWMTSFQIPSITFLAHLHTHHGWTLLTTLAFLTLRPPGWFCWDITWLWAAGGQGFFCAFTRVERIARTNLRSSKRNKPLATDLLFKPLGPN